MLVDAIEGPFEDLNSAALLNDENSHPSGRGGGCFHFHYRVNERRRCDLDGEPEITPRVGAALSSVASAASVQNFV